MPELPEVEVLVRHLQPALVGQQVRGVIVRRAKILRPTSVREFQDRLKGSRFAAVTRRGKYLRFLLRPPHQRQPFELVGHLGMTGRMYVLPKESKLPKHAAVVLDLGSRQFVLEDTRYFGRLTLDTSPLAGLGPEPLSDDFTAQYLARALARSTQAIKVKLLDQSLVVGVGNIYASEALFRSRIPPRKAARRLTPEQCERLWRSVRTVLAEAIEWGSTVPLNWAGQGAKDRLFYYGLAPGASEHYTERLAVYDRQGQPCVVCREPIRRIVQAARSTYYCPRCQRERTPAV